jgi:DNA primase
MSSLLDEVLDRVDILDIVTQYVKLRKAGKNYLGLCPFHKEKTPSFTVSTEKQIFYCFGCHEGGNAVNFLQKHEHLSFQEALEALAQQYNIRIGRETGPKKTSSYEALSHLAAYYERNLRVSESAMRYLSQRNIDLETAAQFKLGYAARPYFSKEFAKEFGVPLDVILSLGIGKLKDGKVFDPFRGRLTIPICDPSGKVIGFGARGLEKGSIPKYVNSPESSIFSKRKVLYGIERAKTSIADKDEALVVEGYFDLISLHKAGITNVVAAMGTSITQEQMMRLRNYTENVTLVLDGDEAGLKSALRLMGLFGELEINGSMVVLPENHDPDSFMRDKGAEGFGALLKEKKPLLDCYIDQQVTRHSIRTFDGKLRLVKSVMPFIESMGDSIRKRLHIKRLAELTGVEEYDFSVSLDSKSSAPSNRLSQENGSSSAIERKVIGILMQRPEYIESLCDKEVIPRTGNTPFKEIISAMAKWYESDKDFDVRRFVSVLDRQDLRDTVLGAILEDTEDSGEEMDKVLDDYIHHAERKRIRVEAMRITNELAEAERRGDTTALLELLERKRQVVSKMKSKSAK